ncbi:MAG TPA: phage tail protein [Syntrophomonadaceae bacterium]|mgnify:CR=1 FL=1|nr:phage tail protein [Syntrophomonadaceae bacterium]
MFDGFKLYSPNRELLGYLKDVLSASVEHEINKLSQMEIELVPDETAITPGMFLEWDGQDYLIQTVTDIKDAKGNYARITAEIASTELLGDILPSLELNVRTAAEALTEILGGNRFGWTVGTVEVEGTASMGKQEYKSRLELLLEVPKLWGGVLAWDTKSKKVDLLNSLGTDNGVRLSYRKNLKELERTVDRREFGTRLYALGKDNLTTAGVNGTGLDYIDADTAAAYGIHDYVWKTDITSGDRLYAAALAKIELIKQPRCSYIVKVADLSILVGYEDYALSLGDTVWIKDEDLGIEAKSTVVKVTEYPLWPEEKEMVIDTVPLSYRQMEYNLAKLLQTVEESKDVWDRARLIEEDTLAEYGMKDYGQNVEFTFSNSYYQQPVIFASLQKVNAEANEPLSAFMLQTEAITGLDEYNNLIYTGARVKVIGGPASLPGYKINLLAFCTDPAGA